MCRGRVRHERARSKLRLSRLLNRSSANYLLYRPFLQKTGRLNTHAGIPPAWPRRPPPPGTCVVSGRLWNGTAQKKTLGHTQARPKDEAAPAPSCLNSKRPGVGKPRTAGNRVYRNPSKKCSCEIEAVCGFCRADRDVRLPLVSRTSDSYIESRVALWSAST